MEPELPLVGRDGDVARLRDLVVEVAAGRGRSAWVVGEPGIGKSALLAAGLAEARHRGCAVFWETADEARQRFPLWVLRDCLRAGTGAADAMRAEIMGLWAAGSATLAPVDVTAAAAERLLDLVDRLCAVSPVVFVVDDLQWADEASLAVWGRLQQAVEQLPLLLVGACRRVPVRAELAALRTGLTDPGAVVIELGPLPPERVAELVERRLGAPPGPRLRRLAGQAGGNPLYVRELLDALLGEQAVQFAGGVAELVGGRPRGLMSLAAALGARLRFLSEPATRALQLAALLGPQLSTAHLRVVSGFATGDLAAAVREAVAAGVLQESGDRLAFRHGLIRQAMYERMPGAVRSGLHCHAAQALAAASTPVELVAEQLVAAGRSADGWMAGWLVDAAPTLIHRAPQVAVELLERVRAAGIADDAQREQLEAQLVTALFLLGRYEEVQRLAPALLADARDAAVVGPMAWALGYAQLRTAQHQDALATMTRMLAGGALTPLWTGRLRALTALILLNSGQFAAAEAAAAQAVAEGRRVGDRLTVGYALHSRSLVQVHQGRDQAMVLDTIETALACVGDAPETTDLRLHLLGNRGSALAHLGRLAEADVSVREALTLAERLGTPPQQALIRLHAASHDLFLGRWTDALAELDAAATEPQADPARRLWLRGVAALIAVHRDDRAVAATHLHEVDQIPLGTPEMRYHAQYLMIANALAAERDGRPEEALAGLMVVFDPDSTLRFPTMDVDRYLWLPDVVRLALAAHDLSTAQAAVRAAADEAARQALPLTSAAADHCRGLLAGDPGPVRAAADAYGRMGYPLYRAQALENAAVLSAGHGDTDTARAGHLDAVRLYSELEAAWDVLRADARLRAMGVRRGSRGPRRRPANGWDALTATEVTVAELVAAGHSNPDIAANLLLSRRTVQSHVSHILTKLDAHSRVDIARQVSHRNQGAAANPPETA